MHECSEVESVDVYEACKRFFQWVKRQTTQSQTLNDNLSTESKQLLAASNIRPYYFTEVKHAEITW